MKYWFFPGCALLSTVLTGCSMMHPAPKIGYAETSKLVMGFPKAQKATEVLEVSQKEWQIKIDRLKDSLSIENARTEMEYDTASELEKKVLQNIVRRRNEDFQNYLKAAKEDYADKEKEMMDPVVVEIDSFLNVWGKRHGYSLILGSTPQGNILEANSSLNVTNKVLRDFEMTSLGEKNWPENLSNSASSPQTRKK
jgi:outer membrane protein